MKELSDKRKSPARRGAGIYKGWVAMKQAGGEQQKIEQREYGPIKSIIFLRTLETPLFNDHDFPFT